jgi:DNA modification methylase
MTPLSTIRERLSAYRTERMGDCLLVQGDCLQAMAAMPDGSVDAVVTDAPYGLSFMGKAWDKGVPGVEVWAQALRVLKPGGHLLAFAGTRTQHRMAGAIEDAGFEIRDMIAWVYGSGFPKSLNVGKAIDKAAGAEREVVGGRLGNTGMQGGRFGNAGGQSQGVITITAPATPEAAQWDGWGTALKPALEPLTLARKPLDGTVAANVLKHGVGGLNVDGCRVDGAPPSVPQPVFKSPTGRIYGMKTGEGRNGEMSQATGRWPANLIHDGSDEVVAGFPESVGSKQSETIKNKGNSWKNTSKEVQWTAYNDKGSAARFFYCAKASKEDREDGLRAFPVRRGACVTFDPMNRDGTGELMCPMRRNVHPTVKPTDLMRYLCRLITPPGGIVLDPFMGSGSTGRGAALEGFRFIGCELEAEYFEIATDRIAKALATPVQQDMLGGA